MTDATRVAADNWFFQEAKRRLGLAEQRTLTLHQISRIAELSIEISRSESAPTEGALVEVNQQSHAAREPRERS